MDMLHAYYTHTHRLRQAQPKACTCICLSHRCARHWAGKLLSGSVVVAAYEAAA